MKSLRLQFSANGASLITDEVVEDVLATAQVVLVNFGTGVESDPMFPDRGTALFKTTVSRMLDPQDSIHEANFAAVDTLFFVRRYEPKLGQDKLDQIITSPVRLAPRTLTVPLQLRFTSGTVVGTLEPLTTNG